MLLNKLVMTTGRARAFLCSNLRSRLLLQCLAPSNFLWADDFLSNTNSVTELDSHVLLALKLELGVRYRSARAGAVLFIPTGGTVKDEITDPVWRYADQDVSVRALNLGIDQRYYSHVLFYM